MQIRVTKEVAYLPLIYNTNLAQVLMMIARLDTLPTPLPQLDIATILYETHVTIPQEQAFKIMRLVETADPTLIHTTNGLKASIALQACMIHQILLTPPEDKDLHYIALSRPALEALQTQADQPFTDYITTLLSKTYTTYNKPAHKRHRSYRVHIWISPQAKERAYDLAQQLHIYSHRASHNGHIAQVIDAVLCGELGVS